MPNPIESSGKAVGPLVVGITGLFGVGKSTVARMLADLALRHGVQAVRYSLSEELNGILVEFACGEHTPSDRLPVQLVSRLREERAKGSLFERENKIYFANELRRCLGAAVLAQRVVYRVSQTTAVKPHQRTLIIIESIRNPGEVLEFRRRWNRSFKLMAVEASDETMDARILARGRDNRLVGPLDDTGMIRELRRRDRGIKEPAWGLQVDACTRMADWHIQNDGSADDLRAAVHGFASQWLALFPVGTQRQSQDTCAAQGTPPGAKQ